METTLLAVDDFVGISFFITSMALLAATVFFAFERQDVLPKWRLSLTVMINVTLVAFVHYLYMRDLWITSSSSPVTYRYIDWFITVPLQIIEFYLILSANQIVSLYLFWRLLIASIAMLVFGYIGETGLGDVMIFFGLGMAGWLIILYEIFLGEASKISQNLQSASTKLAFSTLRLIVTVGWAIYPVGYVYGYTMNEPDMATLNIIYNIADFINKIAFGMVIWYCARMDSSVQKPAT